MKHLFVVDENIIAQGKSPRLALRSLEFFKRVQENCHQLGMDSVLLKKLFAWIKRRDEDFGNVSPSGPVELRAILTRTEKLRFVATVENAEIRKFVRDPDDWFLADIVAQTGGHVVTMDPRTRQDFNRSVFRELCGADGVTIEKAIELASQVDP